MIVYGSSFDCVGIMAKEVSDVQITFGEQAPAPTF